ncbi:cache domain-containing sensor histidine kinase [Neobacillus cucumis]|uniref:cache domain-containing sensor histidine kinase n=1 Tax=Neobacillus cucumis TaxID=1740721 RepID=UPI0019659F64|nr:sensor histidine kinase [Neobacillus cucumis]MBM7653631.1 two-component system sensor histidine kinase YesM [Neobacillus cucumis]
MAQFFTALKKKYVDLKIKYKLFILISWIMIISFSFTVFGLQYAFNSYDKQIYSKSSQVLSTSSNSLEYELKKIEDLSYNILTDPQISQYLIEERDQSNEYEKFRIRTSMADKLLNYVNNDKYIQSIKLINTNGDDWNVGPKTFKLPDAPKEQIIKMAMKAHGTNIWTTSPGDDLTLVSARQIRQYNNLSFRNLGTLMIYINMDLLAGNLLQGSSKLDGDFLITDKKGLIYPKKVNSEIKNEALTLNKNSGYQIKKINGKNYFLVHIKSHYLDWNYINVMPFDEIFKNIEILKNILFILFISMYFIVAIVGLRFAKNITSPLENLVDGMQYAQHGDFKEAQKGFLEPSFLQNDEVGKLHKNFQRMIQQIDELVNENLSKQLTIKETEFKALQAQINPHFLYNTLESINWLAKVNDQEQISRMVEALGFLLRNSISLKKPLITIESELNIVKNYIIIQKYRFEERLDFSMHVDLDVFDNYIPKLTLQPLVENAIHYALETMIEPCKIRIYSILNKENFQLIVEDNGPGMEPEILEKVKKGEMKTRGQGIGLSNIDERIKISFGAEYGVNIESKPNQGTKIIILLPYNRGEEHVQSNVS